MDIKKEIKKINDFNQDAKNIFTEYYILPSGIIIGESTLLRGIHFILLNDNLPIENKVLSFNSKDIYTSIKDNKKNITNLLFVNSDIYFETIDINKNLIIGQYYTTEESLPNKINANKDTVSKIISDYISIQSNETVNIDTNDVESLVSNGVLNITAGKYMTRITKELIPGLRKNDNINILFYDDINPELFKIVIQVNRSKSKMISYHVYTAIFI